MADRKRMEHNTVVLLTQGKHKGKFGLITSGQYMGEYGVSNFWGGFILDKDGNLTDKEFSGYDNGEYWQIWDGEYKIVTTVKFKGA